MKRLMFVFVFALTACAPASAPPPTSTIDTAATVSAAINATTTAQANLSSAVDAAVKATQLAQANAVTPTTVASPTKTGTPTPIPTATRIPTATPIPTPTLPTLGAPRGVTFKFDDGVPADERAFIQNAMAMAQNVFGEAGTVTVYAYSDVNALLDQVAKNFNVSRSDPVAANDLYRYYQTYFDRGSLVSSHGIVYLSAIPAWRSRTVPDKLSSLSFAYSDQAQAALSGTGTSTNPWFGYGALTWAQNIVLFKYGYADPVQFRREAIQRSRGILNSLSTMEDEKKADSEDPFEKRYMGYLALDYLAANYGGEQAVFRKFWENYPKYPGWQLAFKATFGMSLEEFYPKFEEYRKAQFPPYCGAAGSFTPAAPNAPLAVNFVRQDPPGAVTFGTFAPAAMAYTFCASGVQLATLQNMDAAIKAPTASPGWVSCGGNCVIVYMPPSAAPGSYTFAIDLPDKRHAEAQFQHSILPAVTPKP